MTALRECDHDWRLFQREPNMVNELYEPETWDGVRCAPGEKHFHLYPWQEGWLETWYCTRCRCSESVRRTPGGELLQDEGVDFA